MKVIYLFFLGLLAVCLIYIVKKPLREGYRDPIYLNRAKYVYDFYPRANGSIYGFPYKSGAGSWNIFSGFPLYPKAY